MVRNCSIRSQRVCHLKEAGDDVIAGVLVGGKEAVFDKKSWPIAPALRVSPGARGGLVRRNRHYNFHVPGGDKLHPEAARPSVIDDALAVALAAGPVLLVIEISPQLLFEARRDCDKRGL